MTPGEVPPPGDDSTPRLAYHWGMGLEVLVWTSALVTTAGLLAARFARPRLVQDAAVTRAFAIPAFVLGLAAAVLAALLPHAAEVAPLLAASVLFAAAAWCFAPTAGGRFARFEREFWAHVRADELRRETATSD